MKKLAIAVGLVVALLVVPREVGAGGDRQTRLVLTFEPLAYPAPAGTICDFNYEVVNSSVAKVLRFFDASGFRYRAIWTVDEINVHRNLDTGLDLTEHLHYVIERDFVNGTITSTGETWRLRTEEGGRFVYLGAGRYVVDMFTDEMYESTPKAAPDFATTACTSLGGHPAN